MPRGGGRLSLMERSHDTGDRPIRHGGGSTPAAIRITRALAMGVVLAIAIFVIRSRWLGLLVLVAGDLLIILLFWFVQRRSWSRPMRRTRQ